MKKFLSQTMLLGAFLFVPSLHAVQNFAENVNIGTTDANKILTVNGASNLKGLTTIGASNTNANLKVWGNTSVCGNTAVNEKDCCKCVFGLIEDFNPHENQLAIKFCDTADGNHGAFVELSLCSVCDTGEDHVITTIAKGIYVHPNDACKCFDVEGITRIDENEGDEEVCPSDCELDLVFRFDNVNRMAIGLAALDCEDSPTDFYEGEQYVQPGCLFYKVTSCNLADVKVTATEDLSFDSLDEATQALIVGLSNDPAVQEAIADALLDIDNGNFYLNIFLDLDETSQLAILQELLGDLSRGGKMSLAERIKECMKAKSSKKLLSALFEELKAKHKIHTKSPAKPEESRTKHKSHAKHKKAHAKHKKSHAKPNK